jgi:UDP-glucose 4-epimerase
MAKRAVVTGGAGFIGSHVVDTLLARGYRVLALDDLSSGDAANVAAEATLEELDIVDAERLSRAISSLRPHVVCHLAAQASVTVSVKTPGRDLDVNVRGTLNVCEAARQSGAPVIFASTGGALYGDNAPVPATEAAATEPLAPYGASKLGGEAYVATWSRLYSVPNVVLRLGNVYGPRQNPHGEAGVVAIFSDQLLAGEAPTVYGHGKPTRDYVHVIDVARAFVLGAEGERSGTYNVGSGKETSVLELLEILQTAARTSLEPRLEPLRSGELQRSALDSSRIAAELGWRPKIPLDSGLSETFHTYAEGRSNPTPSSSSPRGGPAESP